MMRFFNNQVATLSDLRLVEKEKEDELNEVSLIAKLFNHRL